MTFIGIAQRIIFIFRGWGVDSNYKHGVCVLFVFLNFCVCLYWLRLAFSLSQGCFVFFFFHEGKSHNVVKWGHFGIEQKYRRVGIDGLLEYLVEKDCGVQSGGSKQFVLSTCIKARTGITFRTATFGI